MVLEAIFFDDGRVINDNNKRGQQWKPLIADYFSPKYGGEKEKWMEANTYAMGFVLDYIKDLQQQKLDISYIEYKKKEDRIWMEKTFEFMELALPAEKDYEKITQDMYDWIVPQVKAFYPGMKEAIQELTQSYEINTASGANSRILNDYLIGMGARDCFKHLFGTDLVNTMKTNVNYYVRIYQYAKINPEKGVVIDDNPEMLQHAQKTNTKVIQSCLDDQTPEYDHYFTKPEELPDLIRKIG